MLHTPTCSPPRAVLRPADNGDAPIAMVVAKELGTWLGWKVTRFMDIP